MVSMLWRRSRTGFFRRAALPWRCPPSIVIFIVSQGLPVLSSHEVVSRVTVVCRGRLAVSCSGLGIVETCLQMTLQVCQVLHFGSQRTRHTHTHTMLYTHTRRDTNTPHYLLASVPVTLLVRISAYISCSLWRMVFNRSSDRDPNIMVVDEDPLPATPPP